MQVFIYNTGAIPIAQSKLYSKRTREKYPEIDRKAKIPNLVFLLDGEDGRILIDAGFSMRHPMGDGLRGQALTYAYKATPHTEIWPQLRAQEVRALDYIFLTHPHADHLAGIETRDIPVNQICMGKETLSISLTNWLNYPLHMIKGLNITSGFPETKEIQPIPLPGHTPGHTGFIAGNVAFVGDALESIVSLDDPRPPKKFAENIEAKAESVMKLRELAKQGVLLLSSHDPFLTPTQGQDLLTSPQYSALLSRQEKVLAQISSS